MTHFNIFFQKIVSGWNKNTHVPEGSLNPFGNKLNEKYRQHGSPRCYTMRCAKIPWNAWKLPQKHGRLKYSILPIPNWPGSIFFQTGSGSDIPIIIRPTIFMRLYSLHTVGRIWLGAWKLPQRSYLFKHLLQLYHEIKLKAEGNDFSKKLSLSQASASPPSGHRLSSVRARFSDSAAAMPMTWAMPMVLQCQLPGLPWKNKIAQFWHSSALACLAAPAPRDFIQQQTDFQDDWKCCSL